MNKSLKGVLAQYGVQEVIENLLASFETVVLNPETDVAEQIQEGRMEAHNDVDFIAYLMECHPTDYELQTEPEWRFKQDKADFESEADDIIIAKNL